MIWQAGSFRFEFPRPTLVMGVLNITPDSFSDGGRYLEPKAALAHARQMLEEGADLIDVGAESTRPQAEPVSEKEELRRLMPVLESLVQELNVPLSVDTMKPGVARQVLQLGVAIVNDVAASRADPEMAQCVAEFQCGYVLMHMQGKPKTMQEHPYYEDVVSDIQAFFEEKLDFLENHGVDANQVVLDPGIGFGKTTNHNLQLLKGLRSFKKCRRPILMGVSRKQFIGQVTEAKSAAARLPGSLACASLGVAEGANIIRVHDVAETKAAVRMTEAILTGNLT